MSPPTKTSVTLVSGEYFDHLAPDPSVITLDVLEHGLDVPRFNNQTIRPITVLEHSMRVRRIVRELGLGSAGISSHETQLWALLHDAHEALVPWGDCVRPGKQPWMREAETRVDEAIGVALNLPAFCDKAVEIVKTADAIALYFESLLWQPGALDWAPEIRRDAFGMPPSRARTWSKPESIERFIPLNAPRPGECWRTEVETLLGKRTEG